MTKKNKKRVSEKKRKKRKREKKREGIYKKRGEWKGVSELAGSTHIEGYLMCTPSSCGITLQQKNISPPGSTQPCSRVLAKPCHNSHLLPALHSVASSPNACKEEECSSYDPRLCYSTSFGTCSYAKKGDVFCTSNPKALCQQIMPPRCTVSTH